MRLHETSTLMPTPPAAVSLYVVRWKACLITLFFAGLLLADLLFYFVWPTPSATATPWAYQEPGKTISFIVVLLSLIPAVVVGGYWTLTPRPLLELSATRFVYRPCPLLGRTRSISWDEVTWLSVFPEATRQGRPARTLTVQFTFTPPPDRRPAGQAPQKLQLTINLQLLARSADEVIDLMSAYHPLHSLYTPRGVRMAMTETTDR